MGRDLQRRRVRARSAIQTTQLVKRLEMFVLEVPDPQTAKPIKMPETKFRRSTRVTAAAHFLTELIGTLYRTCCGYGWGSSVRPLSPPTDAGKGDSRGDDRENRP